MTYLLGLGDRLEILVWRRFVDTFRRVPMGAACMTGLDAVTLLSVVN